MSMSLTIPELNEVQTTVDFNVAGMAILIYDYGITFEDEVTWMWGRRWDLTRFIFTVSRYLPFVGMGMTAWSALHIVPPCGQRWFPAIHTISIIASELLMIIRTYTFWHADKRVLYGLIVYLIVTVAGTSVASNFPKSIIGGGEPLPPTSRCLLAGSRNTTFWYAFLALYEIVIMALMVYRRYSAYRGENSSIVRTLYRDGIFYVVSIIAISLLNVVISAALPIIESDLLDLPQVTLHSVLASRIMFGLRRGSQQANAKALGQALSEIENLTSIAYNTPSAVAESSDSSGSSGSSQSSADVEMSMVRSDGNRLGELEAGTSGHFREGVV